MNRENEIKQRLKNLSQRYDQSSGIERQIADTILVQSLADIEYLLGKLEIASEGLQQVKYEYEQGQDEGVIKRMYSQASNTLKELTED
jgi:hypothetical protein